MRETVDLRSYFLLLWRRKWMVLVPTLVAGVVGIIVTMPRFMTPLYRCSATLSIELPTALNRELQGLVANPTVGERLMRLETQIQSSDFLDRIIDNTGMRDDAATRAWAERNQRKYPDMTVDELVSLKLQRYLRQAIRVSSGEGNQIQVSAVDDRPDRCYRLVRSLASGIVEASRAAQLDVLRSTQEFGQGQLLEYKRQLDEAEKRLGDFQRRQASRSVTPGLVGSANLSMASELRRLAEGDLGQISAQADAAGARARAAGAAPSTLDGLLQQGALAGQLGSGRKLERDYVRQSLLGTSAEMTPEMLAIQISRLVAEARSLAQDAVAGLPAGSQSAAVDYLVARFQAELARTRVAEFDREIQSFQGQVTSAPSASLEEQRLQQEVASLRAIYEAFERQITTSQLSEAFEASRAGERIELIEPPQQPLKPFKPKRAPMIALAFVGGLALGVLGAFVVEHHDQSFRDVRDAEDRLGVRVIGTIPGIEGLRAATGEPERQRHAFERFLDDSPGYQEFRKTALALLRTEADGPRAILITSARSEEGKSTASTCLALVLAKELPRERILLIDLDARKPTLARKLGVEQGPRDASEILRQGRWIEGAEQTWLRPNLSVLTMRSDTDVAEFITKERVRWLLKELRGRFDRIVIDSPPNLPVPDPLVLGPEVDAVLLVVKAGVTPREMVRRSLEIQREFCDNVVGVLLNDQASALPYYYSYKHYGYGYPQKKQARV